VSLEYGTCLACSPSNICVVIVSIIHQNRHCTTGHFTRDGGTDHIFVNGNLARVVLATYRLQQKFGSGGNETFLRVGLGWCDTLV
jgi:hypothetical protein